MLASLLLKLLVSLVSAVLIWIGIDAISAGRFTLGWPQGSFMARWVVRQSKPIEHHGVKARLWGILPLLVGLCALALAWLG